MPSSLSHLHGLLPPSIHEVAEVIGMPATLRLVERFGGTTLLLPKGATRTGRSSLQRLSGKVGGAVAEALAHHFGGEPFYVPRCDTALRRLRDLDICETFEARVRQGHTANQVVADLAILHKISDRRIWIILKNTPPEGEFETPDLFH